MGVVAFPCDVVDADLVAELQPDRIGDEAREEVLAKDITRQATAEFLAGPGMVHVVAAPSTPGGPRVAWGGGSPAAARRAGRHGLDFFAQGGGSELETIYADAAAEHGRLPGFCMVPQTDMATTVFVAHDLDKAWEELGPHLLHDAVSYARINPGNTHTASLSTASTIEELRREGRTHRILTVAEAVAMMSAGMMLPLQPLAGGLPPETA